MAYGWQPNHADTHAHAPSALIEIPAGLNATYSFQPLSNLVYTRDQQITTCRGIVMGRLRSPQRNLEVSLMRFCLQKLGGCPAWVGGWVPCGGTWCSPVTRCCAAACLLAHRPAGGGWLSWGTWRLQPRLT